MGPEQITKYQNLVVTQIVLYAPQVLAALVTLLVGLWLSGVLTNVVRKTLVKRRVDATLIPFLTSFLGWGLKAIVFISVASTLGVKTTSFIAILGAAGLAVGLALQGSLSNFAGGVLILMFRPYKVGDVIEAQGQIGSVKEIQIFTTTLINGQNRRIIIPNGALSNGTIQNYTAEEHVRVDLAFGIGYEADIDKAKQVLEAMIKAIPGVLVEPAPVIAVSELADSSVNLVVRPYAKPADYWGVHFAATEAGKKALDAANISIPFPQRDVHLYQTKT